MTIQQNYRPGNGTEGDYFRAQNCDRCVRDHAWHNDEVDGAESCTIMLDALIGHSPPQWSHDTATGESWCSEFQGPCACSQPGSP
jgi:hypothetical protein